MDHQHHVDNLDCNGNPLTMHGGSWIGHVLPGSVFIVWGMWQMLNILVQYVAHQDANQVHLFRSQPYYYLRVFNRKLPVESVLKILAPFVGVSIELHLFSKGHYRSLMCPHDTAKYGWFNAANVNNWQHTTIYPAFLLSGMVDLVGMRIPLPPGTEFVFLSLGFVIEAIIMGTHTKHIPLDQMVHQLFYVTTAITSFLCLLETHLNASFLIAAAKTVFLVLQGTWICAIGRLMFEGHAAWDASYMASLDLAPVLYCYHLFSVLAFFFMCYCAVFVVYHKTAHKKYQHVKATDEDIEIAALHGQS